MRSPTAAEIDEALSLAPIRPDPTSDELDDLYRSISEAVDQLRDLYQPTEGTSK